ncbi:sigma E regulatory protein, MucB/RseB [Paracidovorax avenae ATCC 19860]|uniref:Sigma E regulatory protein, MucB/RseB n=1 Tax=Paracidovorax avenae (strain ATCC 19860 / DSM 7227 / CCUG 15838 / JCM 20985 / LMG 2117 / NCPPB 1011) TaxID=643561 RepID=F0QCY4_PARA1|nr:MucB/RseB C-terminal domain-containing protein [Paracidovorax avenae]ADX45127.1 sigma E regulatory protein, MucB/RseB [Paracidovorax avenae ATCC 19860]
MAGLAVWLACAPWPGAWAGTGDGSAGAVARAGASTASAPQVRAEIDDWVERIHRASREQSYRGSFVVWSSAGGMTSSRIWHATDGKVQIERIEALDGSPRTVFRKDDLVRTFLPRAQVVKEERRDMPGLFPHLPQAESSAVLRHYRARFLGSDRVAGQDASVLWLEPRDGLRFGYRIWMAQPSGLVVKLQTLGLRGQVLEQAAFSQIDFDTPPTVPQLAAQMDDTRGFRLLAVPLVKTTARDAGWQLGRPVAGFVPGDCYKRDPAVLARMPMPPLQCIFSDGLATVSLFFEPYDAARHAGEPRRMDMGATQTLAQRVGGGSTWLTAVGEVPQETLRQLVEQIEPVR